MTVFGLIVWSCEIACWVGRKREQKAGFYQQTEQKAQAARRSPNALARSSSAASGPVLASATRPQLCFEPTPTTYT